MGKITGRFVAAGLFLAALSAPSWAASLNLNPVGSKDDVTASIASVSYDGVNAPGVLTATGTITDIVDSSVIPAVDTSINGTFTLTVHLTSSGAVDTNFSNTLELDETSPAGKVLYSSSNFEAFGYTNTKLEFLFGVGSGDYGKLGTIGVKISNLNTSYTNTTGWTYTGSIASAAKADTYTVAPLPSAVLSGLSGLGVVSLMFCRRKVRTA